MNRDQKRKEFKLDQIIAAVRETNPDERLVEDAAARVWTRISEGRASAANGSAAGWVLQAGQIRGCDGFQALIPAYLAKTLPDARSLLLEDHVLGCVACRHALGAARSGVHAGADVMPLKYVARPKRTTWALAWGIAAVLVLGIAIGLVGPDRLFTGSGPEATVGNVNGGLYRVSDRASVALAAGQPIGESAEIRTGPASSAVVRLVDGSSVEMNQRSDLWISRGWRGTTIHLERGDIIVQAAEQRRGSLYVATRDCLVSVKGTVFAVDEGMKGSRVSVIQGAVRVKRSGKEELLAPGQQFATEPSLGPVPITEEVSWSHNSGEYLALLGELAVLHKQFEAIPAPSLRYDSTLLRLVPEHTAFYAAIPNIGSTLGEASRLFQNRIEESEVLRQWWSRKQASGEAQNTQQMIDRIRNFSSYLGDEIVIAMPAGDQSPILLAEVKRPDFRPFLEQQLGQLGGESGGAPQLVENPAAAGTGAKGRPLVMLRNNILVVAADGHALESVATAIDQSGSSGFASTPFYAAIQQAYQSGAGWLIAADMEQILAQSVSKRQGAGQEADFVKDERTGLADMRYLVMESKDVSGTTENRATLTFAQDRRGIAAWLASPSPMGTLDFISPQASMAVSLVAESPRDIIGQIFGFAQGDDGEFNQELAELESKTGLNVQDDLAGPLGGEVTFALDGPVLPTPSWKVVLEVNDPVRLESAMEKLVAGFNQQATGEAPHFNLTQQTSGGRTFYDLQVTPPANAQARPAMDINYVFADGYLVAAPNRALLLSSIQNRETGYSLAHSSQFTSRLPQDGNTNFSAVFYQNLGAALAPIAGELESSPALSAAQRQSIQELTANSSPSVICAYGGPNQIVIAGTGSIFGMGLESLFGLHGADPLDLIQMIEHANPAPSKGT